MIRHSETEAEPRHDAPPGPVDRDERLGEAIEDYLAMAEAGAAPDPESFTARYPDLGEDLRAALDGLAMVQGLVGDSGAGPGSRLEAGRRVAGYRIVRELGRGGMGIVYEAVHVDLDRPVALKVLGMHAAPDSSGRRRFLNEAKTAAGLHHTHIVPVFDVGQVGGLCYYAMQRIEGCGLDRVVKALRKGRSTAAGSGTGRPAAEVEAPGLLSAASLGDPTRSWVSGVSVKSAGIPRDERPDEAPPFEPPRGSEYYRWVARAGGQAAEALAHAHRRGVIHRDVKPSNLLVDARGTVWVADFGLARRLADPSMTQTDSLLGTPRYMSPEQSDLGTVDGRTDVYSLGTTLYELLTLRPPFDGKTAAELIGQIRDKAPASPRKLDPRLPRDLETIVLKAMAKRPSDRYAGAAELAEDLQRFLATEPVKARRIGPLGRAWRFTRRHPSLTAVSTIATAVVLTTATVAYARVVQERNKALVAKADMQKALGAVQLAKRERESLMRQNLLHYATFVRRSHMPDRRKTGLARLKEAVALGPDAAIAPGLRDEAVKLLALRDIEPRPAIDTGRVARLVFSPETGRLATLSEDDTEVSLWDVGRRERLARHPLTAGSGGDPHRPHGRRPPWEQPTGLAAGGTFVAAIRPGGEGVRLFDVATGARSADLVMPGRRIVNLFATPDGRRLITVDQPEGRKGGPGPKPVPDAHRVFLWDPERADAPIASLADPAPKTAAAGAPQPRNGPSVPMIACSPDGKTIAMAWFAMGWFGDSEITLWDADDGRKKATIATEAAVTSIALSSDGALAAACAGSISRWEVETQKPLPGLSIHQPFFRSLRFSPDGTMLAASGAVNGIEIWDPEANRLLSTVPTTDPVQDLAFSPDGRTLVASADNTTRVWALVEPVGRSRLAAPETRPASRLASLGFSPAGTLAATFWNQQVASARLQCPEGGMTTRDHLRTLFLGFDPEGRLIVPNGGALEFYRSPRDRIPESRLALPEAPPSPLFSRAPTGHEAPTVFGVSASADGRTLALWRHGDLLLVRFRDGAPPSVVALEFPDQTGRGPGPDGRGRGPDDRDHDRGRPPGNLRSPTLSPSGDRLYALAGEPRGWEIRGDRAVELPLTGLPRDAARLALSPDGLTLALGRPNGEVLLADSTDGGFRGTIPAPLEADLVTALAFSPDGELAVGFRSGLIRLWSAHPRATSLPLVSLPGHQGAITVLAYAPDGRRLAAGDDSGADVWELDQLRAQLEAIGLGW